MRISTAYLQEQLLGRIQSSNSSLADASYQLSSGYAAQNYQDIASQSNQLLNMRSLLNTNNSYMSNINTANNRLQAANSALNNLSDLLTQALSTAEQGSNQNDPAARASLVSTVQGIATTLFNTVNTQYSGLYLFSGQNSGTAPLSASITANPYAGSPSPTTYYNGDSANMAVVTGAGTTQTYGITGDNAAFADAINGVQALLYGLQNNSSADINGAINSLQSAQDATSQALGQVGGQMSGLQLISSRLNDVNTFMQQNIDDIDKADTAQASIDYSQAEATLNASLSVTGQILQLSLTDYLLK